MTKRILILCLALVFSVYNTGCSSGGAKDDGEVASSNDDSFAEEGSSDFEDESSEEVAEESTGDSELEESMSEETADGETEETSEKVAEGSSEEDDEELAIEDPAAGDSKQASESDDEGGDDLALDDSLPEDVAGNETGSQNTDQASNQAAPTPSIEEPTFTDSPPQAPAPVSEPESVAESTPTNESDSTSESTPEPPVKEVVEAVPPPRPFFPLQKVKDAAFMKNGVLLNRVYVARQGDTAKSISQKLYGSDRTKDLRSWNSSMARGVKVGDKIYYASPSNPADSQMLTYYEEMGLQPTTYVSQPGDNIRRVSKNLLGSPDSWKEIWSTNPQVESKGDIPAGLVLRYWPAGADVGMMPIASAPISPEVKSPAGQSSPPPMEDSDPFAELSPSSTGVAQNDIPPPPPPPLPPSSSPDDSMGAPVVGQVDSMAAAPPPPPPPPPDIPPVAESHSENRPVRDDQQEAVEDEASLTSDPDTLVAMAFGGVLLIAAAVLYVVIRKNRAKRMVDLGQTQV